MSPRHQTRSTAPAARSTAFSASLLPWISVMMRTRVMTPLRRVVGRTTRTVSHAGSSRTSGDQAVCYTPNRVAPCAAIRCSGVLRAGSRNRMGLLRSVVDTVIGNMSPEERVEAIREVSAQAIELMTPDERRDLTQSILADLFGSLTGPERQALVSQLGAL